MPKHGCWSSSTTLSGPRCRLAALAALKPALVRTLPASTRPQAPAAGRGAALGRCKPHACCLRPRFQLNKPLARWLRPRLCTLTFAWAARLAGLFPACTRLALLAACSVPLVPRVLLCLQHPLALAGAFRGTCPPGPLALAALLGLRYLARRPAPLVALQAPARSGLKEFSSPAWSAGTGRRLAPARARPAALHSAGFSCLFCIAGTSTSALPAGRFPPQLVCLARLALSACQLATAC